MAYQQCHLSVIQMISRLYVITVIVYGNQLLLCTVVIHEMEIKGKCRLY